MNFIYTSLFTISMVENKHEKNVKYDTIKRTKTGPIVFTTDKAAISTISSNT